MRINIYKEKILKLLKKNHLLSIAEIHKKIPDVDYSTVYRNIDQLVSEGEIKKIVLDKDKVLYEIDNKENNHDHFMCNSCGLVDEMERENITMKSLKNHIITDVLVKGICQKCN